MWKSPRGAVLGAILALLVVEADGADFFVAPHPGPGGNGSTEHPWSLAFALSHPPEVKPGDTIWLRGGVYGGNFISYLTGTPASPVVVRAYPGERVTIDGGRSVGTAILTVNGAYAWYWGLEITSSDSDKTSASDDNWPDDIGPGYGIGAGAELSPGLRFINLIVHDTAMGFSAMSVWSDTEIYGCLIYYNGWNSPSGSKGHGIYAQNQTETKKIVDNLIFQQFSHGVHAYTEDGYLDNIWVEGNILFANGVVSGYKGRNLLVGGLRVVKNPTVKGNMLYNAPDGPVSSFDIGYDAGCSNPTIVDNYIVDNSYVVNCGGGVRTGNSFVGEIYGFSPFQYPNNTYIFPPVLPTGVRVFVRPNRYEPGRANVAVYNWARQSAVAVDLSGVLSVGVHFEVRNAQNFFAAPVVSGTYTGEEVSLPMTGLTVATPNGVALPPSTGPEFNAFVVLTKTDAIRRVPIPILPSDSPPPLPRAPRAK